ncbi:MAG: tail fiber protein [Acidobacteriota bacterium]
MDPFLGQIVLNSVNFTPDGWHVCNGALLSVNDNSGLFSLLGIRYGGDGVSNFALPKLESPDGLSQYIIATRGFYPARS